MAVKRNSTKPARVSAGEASLGRMLLISLGLHLATLLVFYIGPFQSHSRREVLPVYHVDLVNLPVANPQAGRPDARPQPPKPAPKVAETPPSPPPPPKEAVRLPEPAKPTPPKPAPPPVAKAEPKPIAPAKPAPPPAKPEPKISAKEEAAAQARIEQMRARQEMDRLKQDLARLAERDPRAAAPVSDAPLGMATGRGSDAGVDEKTWLQAFFKENWRLSEYQVTRRDLQAVVRVVYSPEGELLDYSLTPSGDAVFDDSVKRAILKEKKLPFAPGRRLILTDVIFNLKDLMDKP